MNGLDLCAGPGGWDVAARALGHELLGIELDPVVCETRKAAGHLTEHADIAALDPRAYTTFGELLVGSPPCPAFSKAGKREGIGDQPHIYRAARELAELDIDRRSHHSSYCTHPESMLVLEPLRWALALRPAHIALEQVPPVLVLWRLFAALLEPHGYRTWVGELNAADYGVPQVRRRAFLIASLEHQPQPPPPTHSEHGQEEGLFGQRLPWVTMAEGLGWGATHRPYPTIASSRTSGGPDKEKVVGSGAREALYREQQEGRWRLNPGKTESQPNRRLYTAAEEPAPTIATGKDFASWRWVHERPATTVLGEARLAQPGHTGNPGKEWQMKDAVRLTHEEGAVLQGFPADYPWYGSSSARWQQIGNAVPPPLALHALAAATGGLQVSQW